MTDVVRVCSPLIVATAKGSGNPTTQSLAGDAVAGWSLRTKDIAFVEPIRGNDCLFVSRVLDSIATSIILVTRRFGALSTISASPAKSILVVRTGVNPNPSCFCSHHPHRIEPESPEGKA